MDGTTLAFVERGNREAEPIVLLHGYLGSHLSWRHHIDALAETHRVLALDWFGWGRSCTSLTMRYDYDTEVDRLRRVLDALGVGSCNLFAHDYGGFLALGLCERHPTRVRRLALLNSRAHRTFTPAWATIFGLVGAGARLPIVRQIVARLPIGAIHRRGVRREFARGIFTEEAFAYAAGWMSKPGGGRFYVDFFRDYRVRPRADLARGLPAVSCPTAVIWSRRNPYLPVEIGTELAATIPNAKLTLLEARHFIMEECPREVAEALAELLRTPAHDAHALVHVDGSPGKVRLTR